jgi:hypothetical protein
VCEDGFLLSSGRFIKVHKNSKSTFDLQVSPPCWSVMMTARAIGVDLNMKEIDILGKAEHNSPEFLKVKIVVLFKI